MSLKQYDNHIDKKRRVVITGMAGITALGNNWDSIYTHLKAGKNAVRYMHEWDVFDGLNTRLGAPIDDFVLPLHYTRKKIRSMGRVSLFSTRATELALEKSGLLENPVLTDGRTGIAYGSSTGSTKPVSQFAKMLIEKTTKYISATTYVQMMPHTTAVNTGLFFGLRGRIIPTSSACTSASQAIGYAYETILHGYQTVMVAGGAEELCPSEAAVFDTLFATSQKNDQAHLSPAPFDANRDGLVIGEGSGTLILEELEHALARGAKIYGEIIGFSSNCDASHITQPRKETMQICMEQALKQANLPTTAIGYISAHGTATHRGDIAESQATAALFGNKTPISSLKSYFGHTLGACGGIEAWLLLEMMDKKWFSPTINLTKIDPLCGDLDYIIGEGRTLDIEYAMSNNFAFGGINTSLVFKRWSSK
ncbi:3-oxoacyl-(acyl-carrier-protein) synthase II [Gammaproteobacteria bacterium]|nr:3-oxoacyl-(acyl-carrier-protein) synthase II [Gammaproteobacteria bacterium]